MELKINPAKPPLSKPNKSLQNILKIHSPTSQDTLPPLFHHVKTSSTPKSQKSSYTDSPKPLKNLKKLEKIYEKIQSFESPRVLNKSHKYSTSISPKSESIQSFTFKTPSPKSKSNSIYSEWEIHEALQPLKPRNLREKHSTLISSLRSY